MGGTSSTVTRSHGADEASSTNELGACDGDATCANNDASGTVNPDVDSSCSFGRPNPRGHRRDLCIQTALVHIGYDGTPGERERQGAPLLGGISTKLGSCPKT